MTIRGEYLLRIAAGFVIVAAVLAALVMVLALGMRSPGAGRAAPPSNQTTRRPKGRPFCVGGLKGMDDVPGP